MSNGLSIAGRKRFTTPDFYETPSWAVKALIDREPFDGKILEPACGLGAISEVLIANGFDVESSDIEPLGYGSIKNYFDRSEHVDNVITNPPYNKAQEFVSHSKRVARHKIAMILKLAFMESERRFPMFLDTDFPLATVYPFCSRVQMYPYGIERPKNAGTIAYAWYVWDKEYQGAPQIKWISSKR